MYVIIETWAFIQFCGGSYIAFNEHNSTHVSTSERNFCLYMSSHGKRSAYKDLHRYIVYDKNSLEWAVEETVVYSDNVMNVLRNIQPRCITT